MYPILFSFWKISIYTHGVMIAVGAILGGLLINHLAKKSDLSTKIIFDLIVYSLFAGIIGARIAYVIFYYYQFSTWYEMFYIWYGGLISFGGIIFGFLTAAYFLKKHHQNIFRWFDIGIIGLLFGWSVGRIGCLLSGDIVGLNSNAKIAIWGQVPVALFESIWCLSLAVILIVIFSKKLFGRYGNGFIFYIGIAGYMLGRFLIDFWRDENVVYLLKGGQIASLLMFMTLMVIIYVSYLKSKSFDRRGIIHQREESRDV